MVADPYKALGLEHGASKNEIRNAYRKLALRYHPDRLTARNASTEERQVAGDRFASISSAYALLSDDRRKRDYDHIYKYGGYDHLDEKSNKNSSNSNSSSSRKSRSSSSSRKYNRGANPYTNKQQVDPFAPFGKNGNHFKKNGNKRASKGIGYAISDPFSYMFKSSSRGRKAVAGLQIPSRMQLAHPPAATFRLSFSQGEFTTNSQTGVKQFVTKTTQFVHGKKYSRIETTTVHPDGRKEILIEGNDYIERRSLPSRKKKKKQEENVAATEEGPWYMNAWNGIRDKLNMCHNPCSNGTILVQ